MAGDGWGVMLLTGDGGGGKAAGDFIGRYVTGEGGWAGDGVANWWVAGDGGTLAGDCIWCGD